MSADPNPLPMAAEEYARRGWYIFPIEPRGKKPMTEHGLKDASTNLDTVRRWWKQHPRANIGLNCGKSQVVAIDLDKRGAYDGLAEWAALVERYALETDTAVSLTGGGGRHLLFTVNGGPEIKNSAGKLAPGIDVRGEGGYVVLPPSVHPSGRPYAWADDNTGTTPLPIQLSTLLTREPDPWRLYTLRDAFAKRPPLTWIVDKVLAAGTLNIWFGAPGTLKSLVLADLCVCASIGKPWLEQRQGGGGYATAGVPVMWLDFDNGQRRTHERFQALARAHHAPLTAPLYYVSMPEPTLDAGDGEHMAKLADRIASRDVRLVVIDNLGVISGEADENSAEMQRPMGGLRWLAEATGAAVIVLHHQRKSNGLTTRAGDNLRGHGSIEAKVDLGLLVAREDNDVTLSASKVRGFDVPTFGATFDYENDDQHELVTARFWPFDPGQANDDDRANLESEVLAFLTKHPYQTATAVYNYVGGNKSATLELLREMRRAGKIAERKGAGTAMHLFVRPVTNP